MSSQQQQQQQLNQHPSSRSHAGSWAAASAAASSAGADLLLNNLSGAMYASAFPFHHSSSPYSTAAITAAAHNNSKPHSAVSSSSSSSFRPIPSPTNFANCGQMSSSSASASYSPGKMAFLNPAVIDSRPNSNAAHLHMGNHHASQLDLDHRREENNIADSTKSLWKSYFLCNQFVLEI